MTDIEFTRSILKPNLKSMPRESRDAREVHKAVYSGIWKYETEDKSALRDETGILFRPVRDRIPSQGFTPKGQPRPETQQGPLKGIIVSTKVEPDWSRLPRWLKLDKSEPVRFQIDNGDEIRFQIRVAPSRTDSATRKRYWIKDRDGIAQWWERQCDSHGLAGETLFIDDTSLVLADNPNPGEGRLLVTTRDLTGSATIRDSEKFAEAVMSGIGRGKAFGAGMLMFSKV